MVVLGAHYLPFVFLYGMRMFAALTGILWAGGLALALWIDAPFPTGAWLTAVVPIASAGVGRAAALREAAL